MSDETKTKPLAAFAAEHRQGGTFILGPELAVVLERDRPVEAKPVDVQTFPPKKKSKEG